MTRPSVSVKIGPWALSLAGLAVLLGSLSCRAGARPENVILITLDTQRADYISAYEPANAATPNVDLLAREGTLYRNAYSLIPITLPSHASLFFSEPPHAIRNYNNGQKIAAKRARPSLVNLFRKKGFATAAFVSLGVLKASFGLEQGFEDYLDEFPPERWYLSAAEVNARVFSWLEKNRNRPFFLWVHYSDPHDPYAPPSSPLDFRLFLNDRQVAETSLQKYTLNEVRLDLRPGKNQLRIEFQNEFDDRPDHFLGRLDRLEFDPALEPPSYQVDFLRGWYIRPSDDIYFFNNNSLIEIRNSAGRRLVKLTFRGIPLLTRQTVPICYRREVEYMDGEIGKLWEKLRELQLFAKTAILLVGDHGEGLGEYHNDFGDPHLGHIHFLYDVYLHVPLIICDPSQDQKGIVRTEYVTLLDVAPTIAAMVGIKPLPHFQGRNLLRLKKKDQPIIFEETYRPEAYKDRFGLLSPPWHLLLTAQNNRYELYNLKSDPGEKANLYDGRNWPLELLPLRKELEDFARDILSGKQDIQIDDKTKEMLRALGYIR
jgi:membrane-anchored protein YejM (alkaline phosphatase superfamily)